MGKREKIIVSAFGICAILIAVTFLITYYVTTKDNKKLVTLEMDSSDEQMLQYYMRISKKWSEKGDWDTVGAEYDFEILNVGKYDFDEWAITIRLGRDCLVDSFWNCTIASRTDEEIVIKPLDYNKRIKASGGKQTFGMVIISEEVLDMDAVTISGYVLKKWNSNVMYIVCIILSVIWGVAAITTLIVGLRMASYEKRQKRDEAIIIHTMDTLVDFIEAKDEYTHGHSRRVADYTRKIAERMRIPKDDVRDYYYIALMHDCGKIGIPDDILNKAGKLTEEEFEVIKTHTTIGAQMLSKFTDIKGIQEGALQHHERYDGTGYPQGLKGEEISLIGRIICVADCFDAMNIDRCYRNGISQEKIVVHMKEESGKHFDPEILKVFLQLVEEGEIKPQNSK